MEKTIILAIIGVIFGVIAFAVGLKSLGIFSERVRNEKEARGNSNNEKEKKDKK